MSSRIYIGVFIAIAQLTSCYQKKAERSPHWVQNKYEDESVDTKEDSTSQSDNYYFIDSFNLISTKEIVGEMKMNSKGNWVFPKTVFEEISQQDTLTIIKQLMQAERHINLYPITKNKKLYFLSISKIEELTSFWCEDENVLQLSQVSQDSITVEVKRFLIEAIDYKYMVFAEAYMWLENFQWTLLQYKNIINKNKYDQVLARQIENGQEMLIRLYAFQEFIPLANFSQQLITIIDQVNEQKLTPHELLKIVTETHNNFGLEPVEK